MVNQIDVKSTSIRSNFDHRNQYLQVLWNMTLCEGVGKVSCSTILANIDFDGLKPVILMPVTAAIMLWNVVQYVYICIYNEYVYFFLL